MAPRQSIPIPCLRGVNVSSHSKGMPFNPVDSGPQGSYLPPQHVFEPFGKHSVSAGLECISSLGFNCIRLLVFLEACFTTSGGIVDEYVDGVGDFIMAAHAHRFFVVLDFHQDNYSRRLGGSGLADVFLPASLRTAHTVFKGLGESWGSQPLTDRRYWTCWMRFWDNALIDEMPGWPRMALQELYVYCVTAILQRLYARDGLFVDAIDIINEPCLPEVFAGQLLFVPWQTRARREQLIEFYARAIAGLEKTGFHGYYFLEPFNYDVSYLMRFSIGLDGCCNRVCEVLPGFDRKRLVFAPHCYQPLTNVGPSIDCIVQNHIRSQETGGFSWMVIGELGDVTYGAPEGETILDKQLRRLTSMAIPWIVWEFCPVYEASEAESRDVYRITNNIHSFPWNGEYCSIVGPDLKPLPIYINVLTHYLTHLQEGATHDRLSTNTAPFSPQQKTLYIFPRDGIDAIPICQLQRLMRLSGQKVSTWSTIQWYVITESTHVPPNTQTRQYLLDFTLSSLGFRQYVDAVMFVKQYGGIIVCLDRSLLSGAYICDLLAE
ncbi:Endoglycosylceramidase [Giardia duodenalis]|uniref:Endoglycosylceramidase n=1 Tax=Giardia intestinalis (strain ATCC 50803 / WB clone C6) TaxID=184922 RepID=D3KH60_GIAIC|nr:Endoglycosylceramidase [Giardia intestinalis]KAE8303413.1 Endoglycosylceramidase [Giardia intestinalis]